MRSRHFYHPSLRELTVNELALLLHKSHNESRDKQRQYLVQLGGEGTVRELDYHLNIAAYNADAVGEAACLDQALDRQSNPAANRMSASVCRAVCWFTKSAISGNFGPDDSRDARSAVFLKHPWVIARAVEIFLENLLVDKDGVVLNHDIAEQRAAEFIGEHC
jgi:hypothetical protein